MQLTFVACIIFILPGSPGDINMVQFLSRFFGSTEVSLAAEAFSTIFTTVRFVFPVDLLRTMQCRVMNESFVKDITRVWFLSCVGSLVNTEFSPLCSHEAFPLRSSLLHVFSDGRQTESQVSSHAIHWYYVNSRYFILPQNMASQSHCHSIKIKK